MQGESTFIEDYLVRADRRGFIEDSFFTFCYSPLYDERGEVLGILDTVVETTGKVLAERRLQAERRRQHQLLQQMPGFVAVLSGPTHVYTYANDAYLAISGPRDLLGRTVREAFADLKGQGIYELLDGVYATGEPVHATALPLKLRGDEGTRYVDLLFEPIRGDDGQVTGVFVGGYDTTEHVRAKAELADSEARLRELAASLERLVDQRTRALQDSEDFTRLALGATGGVGVWSYLVAVDKFYCDAAISELYGLDATLAANGISRLGFLANVHPEDMPRLRQTMSGGLQTEGGLELEYRICHPDGTVRTVLSRGHTYFDDAGQPRAAHRRGHRHDAPAPARGAVAPVAEDGRAGPAHRRHRARLQQHAAGHRDAAAAHSQARGRAEVRGAGALHRGRARVGAPRRLDHAAAAGLLAPAAAGQPQHLHHRGAARPGTICATPSART
jgi:PAS domain-containing protein